MRAHAHRKMLPRLPTHAIPTRTHMHITLMHARHPKPTQAHRRCPRTTTRSPISRSAPCRTCAAGGTGAIRRQTHAAVAKHKARTRERPQIPPPPRTRAHAHVYARTECQPLSFVLDTGRAGGHGGRAIDRGAGAHNKQQNRSGHVRPLIAAWAGHWAALGASGVEYDPDQVRVQDLDPVLVKAG